MKIAALFLIAGLALGGCAAQTEAINYRTYEDPQRGMFYIVDGVLDKAALISDVGMSQQRVVITRQAAQ